MTATITTFYFHITTTIVTSTTTNTATVKSIVATTCANTIANITTTHTNTTAKIATTNTTTIATTYNFFQITHTLKYQTDKQILQALENTTTPDRTRFITFSFNVNNQLTQLLLFLIALI